MCRSGIPAPARFNRNRKSHEKEETATNKLIKGLTKFNDGIEKVQIILGCATLALFILMTFYQVLSRFTAWQAYFTEEIATTAFIWTAFMGAPVMLRRNEHYRFTGVAERFRGKLFWVNEFICLCILMICSVLITVHGVRLAAMFYSWRFGSMFHVSKIWLWLSLPVCGCTSVLYLIEIFLKFFRDPSTRAIRNEADKLLEDN